MSRKLILFGFLVGICSLFAKDNELFAKDYKAGEIQSKESFHYGRFETRFYASDVSGILSTMFLYENDGWRETDIWQEIDIEVFGKDPGNEWQSNLIYEEDPAGPQLHAEAEHTFGNNGSVAAWHDYVIEWTPEYVEWFVDGVSVRKVTDDEILSILGEKPMLLMFNCWAHEDEGWVGALDVNNLPTYQFVDYVKVYDWVSDSTFESTPAFEDHFDNGLDNWNKSSHTFDGNLADFTPDNAGTKDGHLVLAFTNNGETGISDASVPEDTVLNIEGNIYGADTAYTVYPNPTVDKLNITTTVKWSLCNSNGVVMKRGKSDQVDMSGLSPGLYILQTRSKRFTIHKQ